MSTEFYQSNITILQNRCPELADAIEAHDISHLNFEVIEHAVATLSINGIQLSSAYDPVEEALAYRSMTSGDTYHIWGFGIGSVPEILLNDKSLKKIHIYIYNLDVIKLVISLMPKFWFSDKRIELHYIHQDMPNQNIILKNLFTMDTFIINSDLQLAKKSSLDLSWIVHRVENRAISLRVNRSHMNPKHMEKLLNIDKENYSLLKKLPVIDYLVDAAKNSFKHVLCIGSAPSLDAHIEDVKVLVNQPNRPLIIAPTTALKALLKNNIKPDIVAVIEIRTKLENIPFEQMDENTILVASSRMNKAVFENWKGKKYYLHPHDETYKNANKQFPSKYRLNVFGSVIHPITNLAMLLGAKTIRLIGCDFGFPNDRTHASSNNNKKINMNVEVVNGYGELIKSSPTYRMFCSGMENLIAQRPDIDFINMSRMGAKIIGARYEDEDK